MRIIALNLTKVHGERIKEPENQINVGGDIKFNSVKEQTLDFSKEPCLKVDFEFKIDYHEIADISICGFLVIIVDEDTKKQALEEFWQKNISKGGNLTLGRSTLAQ